MKGTGMKNPATKEQNAQNTAHPERKEKKVELNDQLRKHPSTRTQHQQISVVEVVYRALGIIES